MLAPERRAELLDWAERTRSFIIEEPSELVSDAAEAKLQADRGSSAFEQLALADFLDHGELDRHLRRTRPIYRQRRDTLVTALQGHLPDAVIHGVAAGLHCLIECDGTVNEEAIVAGAAARSLRVYGARPYRATPRLGPPSLVVGYGWISETLIEQGVKELALVVAECRDDRSARTYRAR